MSAVRPDVAATPPGLSLVTGATGALGLSLVQQLLDAGNRVRALVREMPASRVLPPDVDLFQGDITDAASVRAAMTGVTHAFHLAAKLHVVRPPPAMRAEYERVNVGGTEIVAREAERAGVERLVFFSTIAVYGPSGHDRFTEETLPRPDTLYGETKLAAERPVLGAGGPSQPIGTVLRVAATYGARVKGNYRRLLHALARGRFVPIGAGDNRRTLVFETDVARAALLAARHPHAAGAVFNVTDGQVHTVHAIVDAISRALARPAPRLSVPVAPARFAAALADAGAAVLGRRQPFAAALAKYLEDIAVDGTALESRLGFRPEVGLADGWVRVVRQLRESGEL